MSLLTRTYTFTDGTVAYGSQVETEIASIVNTINNLDSGGTTWTNVKVTTLTPLADVNMNSHRITSLGTPTTTGDAAQYPITASQITAGTITSTQIASGTISNTQLATGTAKANLASGDITQVASSTLTSNADGSRTITTKAITTTGGTVLILASVSIGLSTTTSGGITAVVTRGGTAIPGATGSNSNVNTAGSNGALEATIMAVDTPAAGTYTYQFTYDITGSSPSLTAYSLILVELKK